MGLAVEGGDPEKSFGAPFKTASISTEISPELLGVGYIIGPRIASIMCAGGVLAYLVLIPMISFFGQALTVPLSPETTVLIRDMDPGAIRNAYVLYIGAGAVAAGGLISVFRSLPTIGTASRVSRRFQRSKSAGAPIHCARIATFHCAGSHRIIALIARSIRQPALYRRYVDHHENRCGVIDHSVRLPFRHGFLSSHRRDRIFVQSDFRNDCRHPASHLSDIRNPWLDRQQLLRHRTVDRSNRLHRSFEWWDYIAGPEDRIPRWSDSELAADRDPHRSAGICARSRADPSQAQCSWLCIRSSRYDHSGNSRRIGAARRIAIDKLSDERSRRTLADGAAATRYLVCQQDPRRTPRRRVDEQESQCIRRRRINGSSRALPSGQELPKCAPKSHAHVYIIKAPAQASWALVFSVDIAIVSRGRNPVTRVCGWSVSPVIVESDLIGGSYAGPWTVDRTEARCQQPQHDQPAR